MLTVLIPGVRSSIWVYRDPTYWPLPVRDSRDEPPLPIGSEYVIEALPCTLGTLGRRLPDFTPPTMLVTPPASVVVTVDLSFASLRPVENARSQCSLGAAVISSSRP